MSKKIKESLAKPVKSKQAARAAKKSYKLPSGKTTTNVGLYAAEWKSVSESLAMYLKGWTVTKADPDVTYSTPNGNIALPVWAVEQIVEAIIEEAKEENEFVTTAIQTVLADLKW